MLSSMKHLGSLLPVKYGLFLIGFLLLFLLGGCSGKAARKYTTFNVAGSDDLNNGQPVCLVIRAMTKKDYFVMGYDEIADMVYADPQDESLLASRMLIPGEKLEIEVMQPEKGNIGIYSLYTNPDGNWKVMLNPPFEKKYKISVNSNDLDAGDSGVSLWPF